MRLASHNTFSYLPVRKWWMKPFAWMARCQRITTYQQYRCGVRFFDLRVRFDKKGERILCHGLMEYADGEDTLSVALSILDHKGGCGMRVVLETNKSDEFQEGKFRQWCGYIKREFPNIYFCGGNNRTDWDCKHPIYDFGNPIPDIEHKYSSTTSLFPNGPKWLRRIDDLWPWYYAKHHNKENIEKGTSHEWLMIDFVDIQ